MAGLEKNLSDNSAQKYITASNKELKAQTNYPAEPATEQISIDETTERILVTTIPAAIAAIPLIALASKLLPDIPIYQLYKYLPF